VVEEVEFEGVNDFLFAVAVKDVRIGLFVAGARSPEARFHGGVNFEKAVGVALSWHARDFHTLLEELYMKFPFGYEI